MTRTVICVGVTALLSLTVAVSSAKAQEQFYSVRADAAQADSHIGVSANPLIEGKDIAFWDAVEPLINRYDLCTDVSEIEGADKAALNYTQIYADEGVKGSYSTLAWMQANGLYPFENTSLDIPDPKAPSGFPIFCTMKPTNGLKFNEQLRPRFFDFVTGNAASNAYLYAKADIIWPGLEKPLDYNLPARIQLGASWNLAELWDVSRRSGLADTSVAPQWLTVAAIDAISVAALEGSGVFNYGNYDDVEQRLPFLQGDFSRRLSDFKGDTPPDPLGRGGAVIDLTAAASTAEERAPSDFREDETKGAFLRFLVEDHLNSWKHLGKILEKATGANDPMTAIDDYIDDEDGELLKGLQHAFPAFVANQASLAFTDYRGLVSKSAWLEDSFGGCEEVIIDEVTLTKTTTLEVLPYAARCIILRVEARHAPWHGDLQVQMSVSDGQAGDDRVDDLFMSFAAMGENELVKATSACSTYVKEDGNGRSCILVPTGQGKPRDTDGVLKRLYYFSVEKRALSDRKWGLLLLSYVPQDSRPGGAESRPGVKAEIKWSLDTVIDGSGELADIGTSTGEFELMDMSTATINHGSKVGLAPILTRAPENTDTSWKNIWDGTASPIPSNLLEGAMAQFDNMIQFSDEAGDGFGFVITDPKVLEPGFIGTTEAYIPVGGKDGYMSVPDPDYEGRIEIIENTKDTFYFTVEEGFCMVPESDIPQMIRENTQNFCEFGERVKAEAKGAIAFPELRRSTTKLDPVETDAYRGLRDIRLSRIQERFGFNVSQGNVVPQPPSDRQPPSPVSTGAGGASSSSEIPSLPVCSVLEAGKGCDCSCDAKICLITKLTNKTVLPSESACRLTCGKRWKACLAD